VLVFLRLCAHEIFLFLFWLFAEFICLALENWLYNIADIKECKKELIKGRDNQKVIHSSEG